MDKNLNFQETEMFCQQSTDRDLILTICLLIYLKINQNVIAISEDVWSKSNTKQLQSKSNIQALVGRKMSEINIFKISPPTERVWYIWCYSLC